MDSIRQGRWTLRHKEWFPAPNVARSHLVFAVTMQGALTFSYKQYAEFSQNNLNIVAMLCCKQWAELWLSIFNDTVWVVLDLRYKL
jgi:hypothetical protein